MTGAVDRLEREPGAVDAEDEEEGLEGRSVVLGDIRCTVSEYK